MKKFLLIILSNVLLFSYSLNITKGWQLKGTSENIEVNTTFNKSGIISIWGYQNNNWKVFFNDPEIMDKIKSREYHNIKLLTTIKKNEGFWINAQHDLSIQTTLIDYTLKGTTPDKTLTIKQTQTGENLRAYMWLPSNYSSNKIYPSIVIAHGCGGVHYKDDAEYWNKDYIAGKYKIWGELLSKNGFIVLLVDSFTTRDDNDVGKGVCDSSDALERPAKIDPISVRPEDIASGVAYIKSREDTDKNRVGVLGFSNGATSALVFANHTSVINREEELEQNNKKVFDIPLDNQYKANAIVTLYPGCGLNGYTPQTQHIFDNKFETDTPTYIFMASNDHTLPSDTKEKCWHLRELDKQKSINIPILSVKEVKNSDHQFDYYERNESDVQNAISEIMDIFKSM